MNKFISQYEPSFDFNEADALSEYVRSGGWCTEFKRTAEFEKLIAEYVGVKHAIAVNNGTVAIAIAAMAAGIKPGDKVFVPNYTMIATPNALKLFGAEPIFIDVEPTTLCIDVEKMKDKLTNEVTGVVLVLPNGRFPENGIDEVIDFAKEHSLCLIEDAAQGLGSRYPDERHVGTVGDAGTLSFSTPKIISTGQGGMILTNRDEIAESSRRLKDFGRITGGIDVHDTMGYNFKFTDIQAVIGIVQFSKLNCRIKRKKEIFEIYRERLEESTSVRLFRHDLTLTTPWFIDCIVERRKELREFLRINNVGTREMYPPINAQRAYSVPGEFPVSERVGRNGLWLPSHPQLTDDEIFYVCDSIKRFYGE